MRIHLHLIRVYVVALSFIGSLLYAQTQTQVFQYTENTQIFTVPSGVTSIEIKAWGAGGGGSNANSEGGSGGSGAFAKATLPVIPGQQFTIQVGGGGRSGANVKSGGYAGGGTGGKNSGSGGGYSAVFLGSVVRVNPRVLAGGGGGGAYYNKNTYGGAGGGSDAANLSSNITGGKAGTTTNGSSGRFEGDQRGAANGDAYVGGKGSTEYSSFGWNFDYDNGGGGGGGGYRGGGGGVGSDNGWVDYRSTGGGGGSSYFYTTTATVLANITGNVGTQGNWVAAPGTGEMGYIAGVGRGGSNKNNGGNGLVIITYTLGECTGAPTAGTASLLPNTGAANSIFSASVAGSSQDMVGVTFQWQMSLTNTPSSWVDIPGATSKNATLTAENLPPGTKVYYRRAITCTSSNETKYTAAVEFTIFAPSYCDPQSFIYNDYYIKGVRFLGTRNDVSNLNNGFSSNPIGYQNWTGVGNYATQEQGAAVNLSIENSKESSTAAWVDWNNNGVFESGENIYNTGGIRVASTVFGFTVPQNQSPGYYRLRIRVSESSISDNVNCTNFSNGETEDYLIKIVADCGGKIQSFTAPERCGQGNFPITMQTSAGVTKVFVYDSETANNPIGSVNVSNGAATYTANGLAETKIFYMAPVVGTCETYHRVKIVAKVNPMPVLGFDNAITEFCGDASGSQTLKFSVLGDKETVELINENFNTATTNTIGVFTRSNSGQNAQETYWIHRVSNYKPGSPSVIRPVVASGIPGDGFAMVITDTGSGGSQRVSNLTSTSSFSTVDFMNLNLEYNIYTFFEGIRPDIEEVKVQVSRNGGTSWTTVRSYVPPSGGIGLPNKFALESINLNSYTGESNLKIRFVVTAFATALQWSGDIAAIDNVRLFGEKPLPAAFSWNVVGGDAIMFNEDCVTPYNGATNTVCFKPSAALLKTKTTWTVKATASLSNGCSAQGEITLVNNNKLWNPAAATTAKWSLTGGWNPIGLPNENKCVIIPGDRNSLVDISDAKAKSIKVENGGKLTITAKNALEVRNRIINQSGAENFIVSSDGNLVQIEDGATNSGSITVERLSKMKKSDYTYWSSSVSGLALKDILPNQRSDRFYEYWESDDLFHRVNWATTFSDAKGYAIIAPSTAGTSISDYTAQFKGIPNNGEKKFTLSYTPVSNPPSPSTHKVAGFNLTGNPYPSNIDFEKLADHNNTKIYKIAYFWTNLNALPATVMGSGYTGDNYAVYNGTGGVPATMPASNGTISSEIPTKNIKVGQGFMVKAKEGSNGQDLVFNNTVRTSEGVSHFFSKSSESTERDRFWLQLVSPQEVASTLLVGYIPGATNGFEWDYDAPKQGLGSDAIYSIVEDRKLGIQGQQFPLELTDRIFVGTKHYIAGMYTIRLYKSEGIFSNGQRIYLKDNLAKSLTDLTQGAYQFSAEKGSVTEGRFEIVYKPETTLAANDVSNETLQVYRDGYDFVVRSDHRPIDQVEVYDMSGRLFVKSKGGRQEVRIDAQQLPNGVYVLKITRSGEVTGRKVRK